ncbi:hypothetical protein [Streptomyces sp. NPDC001774]
MRNSAKKMFIVITGAAVAVTGLLGGVASATESPAEEKKLGSQQVNTRANLYNISNETGHDLKFVTAEKPSYKDFHEDYLPPAIIAPYWGQITVGTVYYFFERDDQSVIYEDMDNGTQYRLNFRQFPDATGWGVSTVEVTRADGSTDKYDAGVGKDGPLFKLR